MHKAILEKIYFISLKELPSIYVLKIVNTADVPNRTEPCECYIPMDKANQNNLDSKSN